MARAVRLTLSRVSLTSKQETGFAHWSVPGADREHNSKGLPLEIKTVVPGRPASTVLLFMCIIKPAVSRRIQTVARIFTLI